MMHHSHTYSLRTVWLLLLCFHIWLLAAGWPAFASGWLVQHPGLCLSPADHLCFCSSHWCGTEVKPTNHQPPSTNWPLCYIAKYINEQTEQGSCTFILLEPKTLLALQWFMVGHEIFTVLFRRLCAVTPIKPTWSSRPANWWHSAGELMQNPKEDKSASKEEPLRLISVDVVARGGVRVGTHQDASTYGNESKHQKSGAAAESSFNQEGVRTASEATIMWEVPGLTQEVRSVHRARLITNINHSVVCSTVRSRSCWKLLIFHDGRENATNISTTFFTATSIRAYHRAGFQPTVKICLLYVGRILLENKCIMQKLSPFYLSGKRQTTELNTSIKDKIKLNWSRQFPIIRRQRWCLTRPIYP